MNAQETATGLLPCDSGWPSPDIPGLLALLAAWPLHPYSAYAAEFDAGAYGRFRERRVRKSLSNPHARMSVARSGDSISGSACWSFLPWDTEQLGVSTARLEWLVSAGGYDEARQEKAELLRATLAQCRSEGIRYLIARMHAADLTSIHALEQNGFELIDGIQTFSRRLDRTAEWRVEGGYRIRRYEPQDLEEILAIARSSYVFDRFHMDAFLSREAADAVNERWVENSCLGRAADAVIVALEGSLPVGYVTAKIDSEAGQELGVRFGTIGMVATAPALRGRGVARAATCGALQWFAQQGVDVVEVGTQLCNIAAGRLYEQCGFRLAANSLTFRKLL